MTHLHSISVGGRWDPERLSDLPKVTQLVGGRSALTAQVYTSLQSIILQRQGPESGSFQAPISLTINGGCTTWHAFLVRNCKNLLSDCG